MSDSTSKLIDWVIGWFPILFGLGVLAAFAVWFIVGIGPHLRQRRRRIEHSALEATMHCSVYARIMEPILPMARGRKYEEPLDQALVAAKLGVVTGGGTQMGKDGGIAWVEVVMALADLDGALQFARQQLRELGAPAGSALLYRVGDQQVSVEIA
jgi:hypothetical protein